MTPPELARNAPVLDVFHPVPVGVDPVLRHEFHRAVLNQLKAALAKRVHFHEPLVGEIGLDDLSGTVTARHLQFVRFFLHQQSGFGQVGQYRFTRALHVQPAVFFRHGIVQMRVGGQDVDHRQAVALADRIVVEVVCRGDFDHAGTEFAVHVVVGDDWNLTVGQRQLHGLADQMRVAFVFRMHHHRGVAEQGFRAGGGHSQRSAAVGQRVGNRPQETVFFFADHFQIGDGRLQYRIPIDQTLSAVDQAFGMQAHESFYHCVR